MNSWITLPLGELCSFKAGSAFPQDQQGSTAGDYPFVKVSDLSSSANSKYLHAANNWISLDQAATMRPAIAPAGAVLFAKIGEGLRSERCRVATRSTAFDNNLMSAVALEKNCDPDFLFYLMQTVGLSDYAEGSALPYLKQSVLQKVPCTVPAVFEQRAIAEVLGALDDKIAANTKLAESITEYVSTRFDSEVYAESTRTNLADVCEFQNRRRVPLSAREREEREGSIPYYGASGIFGYVDEPLFNETLVLVGEDGSVIRDDGTPVTQYIWGPAWVNNHAHVLRGTSIPTDLLYFAIRRQRVASLVTGAVQPKISMGNLKRLTLELPSATALEQLSGLAKVAMASYRSLSEENTTLAATRDALLPQLMSGKLRVKDVEHTMGEMV